MTNKQIKPLWVPGNVVTVPNEPDTIGVVLEVEPKISPEILDKSPRYEYWLIRMLWQTGHISKISQLEAPKCAWVHYDDDDS